jgi:wyosine [tRNA(Phe)-imidazoG37] synthetase (radical SAM superfamily)
VAVLTNGSLLWDGMVQRALAGADLVIPSLDAGDPRVFQRVNRPHPALDFEQVTKGLVEFRRGFDGQIWLEVFLVEGVNATSEDVLSIRELADSIEPDRIQLNTVVRPAAEDYALRVSNADMDRIRAVFGNRAEVIAPYETAPVPAHGSAVADDILEMLRRRPCTLDDVAAGLGIHRNEAIKYLAKLVETHLAEKIGQDSTTFYRACESSNAHAEERNRT